MIPDAAVAGILRSHRRFEEPMKTTAILVAVLFGMVCNSAAADQFLVRQQAMVEHDIKGRGISDQRVLEVMVAG